MDMTPQISMEQYQQVQPCYYDMGVTQCQLPIDENMQNVNFQHVAFDEEDKENLQSFFFGQQF